MPRKPTTPFGYFAFGKEGAVKAHFETLSDKKHEQERRLAEVFVDLAEQAVPQSARIELLRENDQDFAISIDGKVSVEVQCTEIVFRDFVAPQGTISSESIVTECELKPVDTERRDNILVAKIQHKLSKHYATRSGVQLWLLVWSVTGYMGFYEANSGEIVPECVKRAREFVRDNKGPFDRYFVFNLLTRPTEI